VETNQKRMLSLRKRRWSLPKSAQAFLTHTPPQTHQCC